MEQSVLSVQEPRRSALSDQDRRWVDAVVKTTAMTYDGRLEWEKEGSSEALRYVVEAYSASLPNSSTLQSFSLVMKIPKDGAEREVIFAVKQNGVDVKKMGNLTIVQALADAVLSKFEKVNEKEETALSAIESA